MNSLRKVKVSFYWLLMLIASVIVIEIGQGILYSAKERSFVGPAILFAALHIDHDQTNIECRWGDSIQLHPIYLYHYKRSGPCASNRFEDINSFGFMAPEFNLDSINDFYSILFLGGSVAESVVFTSSKILIEDWLNSNFISPNGKPFKIISFSIGGGRQPMQFNIYSQFVPFVNAVVSLEGFNELMSFYPGGQFTEATNQWKNKVYEEYESGLTIGLRKLGFFFSKTIKSFAISNYSYSLYSLARLVTPKNKVKYQRSPADLGRLPYPDHWSEEKSFTVNLSQYKSYLKNISSIADSSTQHHLIFLQPLPAFRKNITENEKRIIGRIEYKEIAQKVYGGLLDLDNEGVNIVDLRNIFDGVKDDLFIDQIHTNPRGDQIIAKNISK